jgi:hypothetical protein
VRAASADGMPGPPRVSPLPQGARGSLDTPVPLGIGCSQSRHPVPEFASRMRALTARTLFALLGLAIVGLLAHAAASRMPRILVPPTQGTPRVPGCNSYTYSYSVWGAPKQQEDSPEAAPVYEYRSVAVCPWGAGSDPDLYRPDGRARIEEARSADVFGEHAARP